MLTLGDRHTRCIVAWSVGRERSEAVLQGLVDAAAQAQCYSSDLFAPYPTRLDTPGVPTRMPDTSQTYWVEGDHAEWRHYLACLARKSRCCSRCLQALQRAIKLLVFAWHRRPLDRQRDPPYPAHLPDFACP